MKRIDQEIITERSKKLHSIMKDIARKRNSRWLGWEGDVLLDEIDMENLKGRNQFYKSIVIKNSLDKTITKTNDKNYNHELFSQTHGYLRHMSLKNSNDKLPLGKTVKVKITGYTTHSLEGIQIR
jgi:tRNA A37 methylthiotransferase MiaB